MLHLYVAFFNSKKHCKNMNDAEEWYRLEVKIFDQIEHDLFVHLFIQLIVLY